MDSLDRKQMISDLMRMVKEKHKKQMATGGGQYQQKTSVQNMGNVGGNESAKDQAIRRESKAKYGKYNYRTGQYEGGLAQKQAGTDRMGAETDRNVRTKVATAQHGGTDEWGQKVVGSANVNAEANRTNARANMTKANRPGKIQTAPFTRPDMSTGVAGITAGPNGQPISTDITPKAPVGSVPSQAGVKTPGAAKKKDDSRRWANSFTDFLGLSGRKQ